MPEDKSTSPVNAGIFAAVPAFVQGLTFADLPADVVAQARRCLLDLIGVAAAGSQTDAAQIVNNYAATQLRSRETEARMLFGGRGASPAGAAFAGATTIDSFDAHDGHDLGSRWRIHEQCFKAYPVCRWAQPAIEAALTLQSAANFSADDIEEIAIETFAEAAALGAGCAIPNATDEAQYSLPHPVAAALVFGQVGAEEIALPRLADPRIRRLLAAMKVIEDAEFSRRFPAERWARVRITLKDGRMLASEPAIARGNPENPLTDDELRGKYRSLAEPVLGVGRAARIERLVDALHVDAAALRPLIDDLMQAPS